MRISKDIESALCLYLENLGYSASAHRIPATLGATSPHIHIVRTGGTTRDRVLEFHNVDFDVYATDPADAMTAACNLCAVVRTLEGGEVDVPVYQSEVTTLPYDNPDPRHPTLGRATLKAQIITRTSAEYEPVAHRAILIADTGDAYAADDN